MLVAGRLTIDLESSENNHVTINNNDLDVVEGEIDDDLDDVLVETAHIQHAPLIWRSDGEAFREPRTRYISVEKSHGSAFRIGTRSMNTNLALEGTYLPS